MRGREGGGGREEEGEGGRERRERKRRGGRGGRRERGREGNKYKLLLFSISFAREKAENKNTLQCLPTVKHL